MNGRAMLAALALTGANAGAKPLPQPPEADRARLFVLSDIGNEPDDQMSLVRLLLYTNEIDVEGFGAVTSVWQRQAVHPDIACKVIAAYGAVVPRLREHGAGWPTEEELAARVRAGVAGYGMAAIKPDHPSPAALALLAAADRPDSRPLWVSLWGGANTLAEALEHARRTLAPDRLAALVGRLRVYAISDQDDAGAWIRREFPGLFWIGTPSTQDGADYGAATWTGISGDRFYRNGAGADFTTVSNTWLDANIRSKGPLGAAYPRFLFIMEGDTPSWLGLIPNGLVTGDHPDRGGWGGRYVLRTPRGETRPIWTQGGDSFWRATSADTVDGHTSDQATIWRWRESFQNDFAARMDWTIKPFAAANHPPHVVINGHEANAPLVLHARVGQTVVLDASASSDPDGNGLHYRWIAYGEAGADGKSPNADLVLSAAQGAKTGITVARRCTPGWLDLPQIPCPPARQGQIVLAVSDDGQPSLTRYARVIVEVDDETP